MSSAYAAKRPVVLVVEDEVLIRLHAAQIIAEAEFDVIEASSADEAIAILEARSDITVPYDATQGLRPDESGRALPAMRRQLVIG